MGEAFLITVLIDNNRVEFGKIYIDLFYIVLKKTKPNMTREIETKKGKKNDVDQWREYREKSETQMK
uniref:Uncharacterized protein n=1 Tax=Romanomermis culicivorax TaxID=13658 RepID=A0A915HM54_ROMCU